MNIAIIDDEKHCVESLVLDLQSLPIKTNIVLKSTTPEDCLQDLSQLKIDLLFLDVEMPILNGFELLEQLTQINFDVVFTTAHSEYAVKAFRNKAYNFLLKPVDIDDLEQILSDWKQQNETQNKLLDAEAVHKLLTTIKTEGLLKNKIAIPVAEGFEFLEVADIVYCQSENNYTRIVLANQKEKLISKTLKEVEQTLNNYLFMRIHQSYLINPNYLKKYHKNDGGYVVMEPDKQLPVSKSKKELLVKLFEVISRNQ
ncbi:LytR/AlgR family response regulator transcription factor [Geofilum rubicundum]|nr:LytTR family DNA-binding domain-containing protein [Geofilum rubicundum]